MDINIPENSEKRKTRLISLFFVPALVIFVGVGSFGLGRLTKIKESRPPVTVEYLNEQQSGTTTVQNNAAATTSTSPIQAGRYVAARGGTAYFLPWCATAQRIAEKNKIWFNTKEEAEKAGYKPAQNCKGL